MFAISGIGVFCVVVFLVLVFSTHDYSH
jgi:hypothetical protein